MFGTAWCGSRLETTMRSWFKQVTEKIPRSILSAALVALILLLAMAGFKNYHDLQAAGEREALLQRRIDERRQEVEDLEVYIRRLKEDPELLERLAREKQGMAYSDDLVLLLPAADEPDRRANRVATIDEDPSGE